MQHTLTLGAQWTVPIQSIPPRIDTQAASSWVILLNMKWNGFSSFLRPCYHFDIQLSNEHQLDILSCPSTGLCSFQILNKIVNLMKKPEFSDIHFLTQYAVPEMISIQGSSCLPLIQSGERNISPFPPPPDYCAALCCVSSVLSTSQFILIISANEENKE